MPVCWKIKQEYVCFLQPLHHVKSAALTIQTQALLQALELDPAEAVWIKLIPTHPPPDTAVSATVTPPSAAGLYHSLCGWRVSLLKI